MASTLNQFPDLDVTARAQSHRNHRPYPRRAFLFLFLPRPSFRVRLDGWMDGWMDGWASIRTYTVNKYAVKGIRVYLVAYSNSFYRNVWETAQDGG